MSFPSRPSRPGGGGWAGQMQSFRASHSASPSALASSVSTASFSASSGSTRAAGKSGGVPSSSMKKIVRFETSLFSREGGVCGGAIGESGKMCVARDCGVELHKHKKSDVLAELSEGGVAQVIFIEAQVDSFGTVKAVHERPWLDAAAVDENDPDFERQQMEARPLEHWCAWMALACAATTPKKVPAGDLESGIAVLSSSPLKRAERASDGFIPTGPSQVTKRFRVVESSIPPFQDIPERTEMPMTMEQMWEVVKALQLNQDAAIRHWHSQNDMMYDTREVLEQLGATSEDMVDRFNSVLAQIGKRPHNVDAASIWVGLGALKADVDEIQEALSREISSVEARFASEATGLKSALEENKRQFVTQSDMKVESRNLLAEAICDGELGNQLQGLSGAVDEINWTLENGPGGAGNLNLIDEKVAQATQAALADLRSRFEKPTGSADIYKVKLSGKEFTSLADCQSWALSNGVVDAPFVFLDVVSLLTIANPDSLPKTASQYTKDGYDQLRSGFRNIGETLCAHSFNLELPDFFGKVTNKSGRFLPSVPDNKAWDPEDADAPSVKRNIDDGIEDNTVGDDIEHSELSDEAKLVANDMLLRSTNFAQKVCKFIDDQYKTYTVEARLPNKLAWALVAAMVRVIFKEIYKVRKGVKLTGLSKVREDNGLLGRMLWCTIQAHGRMEAYLSSGIANDVSLNKVTSEHVLMDHVPKAEFDALKKDLDAVKRDLKDVKTKADRALTRNNN